jgi:hypothetical protein
MTALSPGAIVKAGVHGDLVFVVRCQAARHGYWHLQARVANNPVLITRVERTSALRLVRPAPVYKPGERVTYQGHPATVLEDMGDHVAIVAGLSRVEASKADLVLERL